MKRMVLVALAVFAGTAWGIGKFEQLALERAGGIYHSYEFVEPGDTPAPEGFAPFYVSHYGRHGSRRLSSDSLAKTLEVFEAAEAKRALTDAGRNLLYDLRRLGDVHDGMVGQLSRRGAEEHRRLAERMAKRFPEVFRGRRKVLCRATTVPRVLMSQTNFAIGLMGLAPYMEYSFETGERHDKVLMNDPKDWDKTREKISEMSCSLLEESLYLDDFFKNYFTNVDAIGERAKLALNMFKCASICQCLRDELDGMDIYRHFRSEDIAKLSRSLDASLYWRLGNSAEFGDRLSAAAAGLLRDIVERADDAILDDKIAADLRFGHDTALWPLLSLIGLQGSADRVPATEAWRLCPAWKSVPMAGNFQLALYRNFEGEILAKIMVNELEMRVKGLKGSPWPYYRWEDLKRQLVSVADSASGAVLPLRRLGGELTEIKTDGYTQEKKQ